MKTKRVITLLTDFGLEDEYAGVMKGVILSINGEVEIVDVTHQLRRHDIVQAALVVESSFRYFPPDSIHVVVVDPGVGGKRNIICAASEGHYFLVPDNGVLEFILARRKVDCIHAVTDPARFLREVSATFHGRDIFAPVAAHLAGGLSMSRLGNALTLEELVRIDLPTARRLSDGRLLGTVVSVDHFGNLITNIDRDTLGAFIGERDPADVNIRLGGLHIAGISTAYNAVPEGGPLAVVGSKNRLEISINQGDARTKVKGDEKEVTLTLR